MYWLVATLVFGGILPGFPPRDERPFHRPAHDRSRCSSLPSPTRSTGAFYVIATTGALLVFLVWKGENRRSAGRILLAMVVGLLLFVPWLPTFLYQLHHTGTPWGQGRFVGYVFGQTFLDFSGGDTQEGYLLWFVLIALVLLGVFTTSIDERRIEVDLVPQPDIRVEAYLRGCDTGVGRHGVVAHEQRVDSALFVDHVPVRRADRDTCGVVCFADVRVRAGRARDRGDTRPRWWPRNAVHLRTQAGEVAAALRIHSRPGDLVVMCPDQLGPATNPVAPRDLVQMTYPRLGVAEACRLGRLRQGAEGARPSDRRRGRFVPVRVTARSSS